MISLFIVLVCIYISLAQVRSYVSWCTGLPAPEAANVPLKYKFSWSPLAVLLNTLNPAKCLVAGEVHITITFQ